MFWFTNPPFLVLAHAQTFSRGVPNTPYRMFFHCVFHVFQLLRNLIYRCSAYAARVRKFPTIIVNNKNGSKIANIRPNDRKLGNYQE